MGIVTDRLHEAWKIDIGCHELAQLHMMSFEGASKKNRANLPVNINIFQPIFFSKFPTFVLFLCPSVLSFLSFFVLLLFFILFLVLSLFLVLLFSNFFKRLDRWSIVVSLLQVVIWNLN